MLRQPIQVGVEIVFVEADHAERRAGVVAARQRRRRQARALVEDTGDDFGSFRNWRATSASSPP
jgi:hypothetical protein